MPQHPLKLLSSMAAREVLAELIKGFTAQTGQPVDAEAAGGREVAKRIQAGEAADVVVLSDAAIDKLIAGAQLRAGRMDLVKSGVAIAVRSGASRPDVSTEAAVQAAVSAAPLAQLFHRSQWGVPGKAIRALGNPRGDQAAHRGATAGCAGGVTHCRRSGGAGLPAIKRTAERGGRRCAGALAGGHPDHHDVFGRDQRALRAAAAGPRTC